MGEDKTLGERVGDYWLEYAKREGLPVITRVIHFPNDDVPRYLENLRRFEQASREAGKDFRVHYQAA